jgi:Zn-dependent metalloprotease
MKTNFIKSVVFASVLFVSFNAFAQKSFSGTEAENLCKGSKTVVVNKKSRVPSFIVFREDTRIAHSEAIVTLRTALKMNFADALRSKGPVKDEIGYTHERFAQTYNNIRVEDGEYITHSRNGILQSANGMWFDGITLNTNAALSKDAAVTKATAYVGAATYKWEIPAEEAMYKVVSHDENATYYPQGELVIICRYGDVMKKDYVLAWKLDIYAHEPMSRQWIFVDANTGEIVDTKDRIHHIDTPASGITMYSGTQNFTCDNYTSGQYRLRESGRGQGIQTLNLNNGTSYGAATDFTNTSTTWTNTANDDHAGNDAHWGAEGTYDFFMLEMGRNGLDGNGMEMFSYVHYSTNYNNAFWNGSVMTYGDGSGTAGNFNPLVAIDVCGHEFTHGVTEFTSNLDYQDESGALNESFSDIFGTAIEFYKKPNTANFLMGEEITVTANTALRSMSNPNQYGDPDCYGGTNWYTGTADNGGVHTNSGVQNFWYYLASQGGSGTNDNNDAYSITGIGWYDAARIAFRNNCFYLVNTSDYADSRTYSIQSAQDLFGACTPEVIAVTNAWYACGVGPQYNATVTAAFSGDVTTSCSVPFTVNFTNTSTNASSAAWDFGDNTTDTLYNASHTYTTPGTYNVQLNVSSACGTNTTVQNSYIVINTPASPTATGTSTCNPASVTLNASGSGTLNWYTQPAGGTSIATGTTYTTPVLSSTTTYYVSNAVPQAPVNAGPANNNFGTGGQHNNTSTQYLEFTVYQNCVLQTAVVNAGSAGNKTFTLWDGAGVQLNQYTVNVPNTGVNTVTLNIPLTPGNYRIGGTQMNLYRNNSGAAYPYTGNGVLNITGSSAGSAFYYYLYNWTVAPEACTSQRVPVTVTVGAPNLVFDASAYDTTCTVTSPFALTGGSPAGGTYSGPGVTGNIFDPVSAGVGTHTITYTYTDSANCTGSATQQIYVDVCAGLSSGNVAGSGLNVFPNPAEDNFTIEYLTNENQPAAVTVTNALGQTVYAMQMNAAAGVNRWNINSSGFSAGMYFVMITSGTEVKTSRLEVK